MVDQSPIHSVQL